MSNLRRGHAPVEDVALGGTEGRARPSREELDDGERGRDREELERTGPPAVSRVAIHTPSEEAARDPGATFGDAPSTVFVIGSSSWWPPSQGGGISNSSARMRGAYGRPASVRRSS